MSDDDATGQDAEETTVIDRRQLALGADEPTVTQPAVALDSQADRRTVPAHAAADRSDGSPVEAPRPQPTPARAWEPSSAPVDAGPPAAAVTAAPVFAAAPVPGAEPGWSDPVGAPPPAARGPRRARQRRTRVDDEHVRLPVRRPWTSVTAAVLSLVFAGEALYELVHNWSGDHPQAASGSRFAAAYFLLEHSAVSITTTLATLVLGPYYHPAKHFDARIALGSYAILWLIVGLLLLVARGSGIIAGLVWCGAVGVVAAGRGRNGIHLFGLHRLGHQASVVAMFAPLILIVLISALGGSRRARLYSARPSEPEFVDVNEPGQVWPS